MRLTLRTMLAYLDDILEPQDNEDISKKIEESEFASDLVHRTRDCMRRLRLGVPPLSGKGLASDANTVAEYLDNTLSAERVAEFERICLESDVHLSEVASCHQILTLVLGEPAQIDPKSRDRMYRAPMQAAAPPVQHDAMQPAATHRAPATGATPPAPPRRPKPEIPEYLRESRSRYWPVAAAVVVGALVTVGALAIFGPAEWRQRVTTIADGDAGEGKTTPVGENGADAPAPPLAADGGAADEGPGVPAVPFDPQQAPAPDVADNGLPTVLERPQEPPPADSSAPAAPLPGDDPAPRPSEDRPPKPEMPAEPAEDAVGRPASADGGTPVPPAPMPDEPAPQEPPPTDSPDGDRPSELAPVEPDDAATAEKPGDAAAAPLDSAFGRYLSKREVLLRLDRESGDWKRLPVSAPLAKGDRLLSFPIFRPAVSLSTSISIQPDGAAELELVGWTEAGVPIVAVDHGRLLMMTNGRAGNSIQLQIGEQTMELTFVDAESTLALEARRVLPPGQDPLAGAAPLGVDLYVISGSVRVRVGSDPPLDLQAPMRRALVGSGIEPPGEFPSWVTSAALSDSEQRAIAALNPLLPADQFIGLTLKELSNDRRREVRSLAIRSATYLGNFDPCTEALNEKDEKNLWPEYIAELRAAVARNPDTAERVRAAFAKQRGADGEAMFRMLWGYTAEGLRDGAAAQLVDGLDHDSLDYRVLAITTLQRITGPANYGYYPADLAKKRAPAVKRWKDRLRSGKIVPQAEPVER